MKQGIVVGMIGVTLLLGGCGARQVSSHPGRHHTEQVKHKPVKQPQESAMSSTSSQTTSVDTRHLSADQVNKWVYQDMITEQYTTGNKPPMDAFTYGQDLDDDNCVEITVRQNPDNAWMKQNGGTSSQVIAVYRINQQGQLQLNSEGMGGGDWQSTNCPYPGN